MKDSGVEWIGEIPQEWDLGPVKYWFCIEHGTDPILEGDVPVFGSGASSFKTCGEFKVGPAVLLGRKGATLHIPTWIPAKMHYWNVDTAFNVVPLGGMNIRLFYYLSAIFDYEYYKTHTVLPSMTQTDYLEMTIPVPPPSDQEEIISYLDSKCAAIDSLKADLETKLTDLAEYRKSLIFDYVTGKKEVPASFKKKAVTV